MDLILERWLRRSTSAPLDISLIIDVNGGFTIIDNLLELILGEVHRWREMKLTASFAIDLLFPFAIRCLPQLESLDLYFFRSSPAILDISSCTATANKTKSQLRTLSIDHHCQMRLQLPERKRDLYLPILRTLSFCTNIGPTIDDAFALLAASPSLSHIDINVTGVSESLPVVPPSTQDQREADEISLLHATDINIKSCNSAISQILLGRLSCPSLKTFTYLAQYSTNEQEQEREFFATINHLQSFDAFFRRSGTYPPLTTLSLSFFVHPISPALHAELAQALKDLLGCLDTLEVLNLWGMVIDDELIQSLTPRTGDRENHNGNTNLCPSLKDLSIRCAEAYGLNKKTMEDMIVSRWTCTGTRLRSIKLIIPGFNNLATERTGVRKCVKEGLVCAASSGERPALKYPSTHV